MVQQYMVGLRGIIISNGIISKAPSITINSIIIHSGTCRRTDSIRQRTWDITQSLLGLIKCRPSCLII